MVSLTDVQQSQTRFHLGYHEGIPAGDRARLLKAMTLLPDAWTAVRVGDVLVRCEDAYDLTALSAGDLNLDSEVDTIGDTTQTTQTKARSSWEKRQRYYLLQTDSLALTLGVRNYRNPQQALNGYLQDGGLFINSVVGPPGEDGSVWLSGAGAPTNGIGETLNDLYLNTDNGDLYQKSTNTSWSLLVNLRGVAGTTWYTGSGAPTDGQFTEAIDDFYLDSASGDYYQKTDASTWTLQGNIEGPKGDTGDTGPQGIQGEQGVKGDTGDPFAFDATGLFSERSNFDAELEGFAFLATDTGDLYIKNSDTSGDWSSAIAFQGDKGDTGSVSAASALELIHTTTPSSVDSGETWFYAKADGKLYFFPAGGSETEVGAGAGGGGASLEDIWMFGGW